MCRVAKANGDAARKLPMIIEHQIFPSPYSEFDHPKSNQLHSNLPTHASGGSLIEFLRFSNEYIPRPNCAFSHCSPFCRNGNLDLTRIVTHCIMTKHIRRMNASNQNKFTQNKNAFELTVLASQLHSTFIRQIICLFIRSNNPRELVFHNLRRARTISTQFSLSEMRIEILLKLTNGTLSSVPATHCR